VKNLKLSDAHEGDVVRIDGVEYRMTMRFNGAWGCRHREEDGTWSIDHTIFTNSQEIEEIVEHQPRRNPKARKERKGDLQDPLLWKGTVK
jgi:hypothetical protein